MVDGRRPPQPRACLHIHAYIKTPLKLKVSPYGIMAPPDRPQEQATEGITARAVCPPAHAVRCRAQAGDSQGCTSLLCEGISDVQTDGPGFYPLPVMPCLARVAPSSQRRHRHGHRHGDSARGWQWQMRETYIKESKNSPHRVLDPKCPCPCL